MTAGPLSVACFTSVIAVVIGSHWGGAASGPFPHPPFKWCGFPAYGLLCTGQLGSVKAGRRRLIGKHHLEAFLGAIHLVLTLRDLRHPRYFKPIDEGLIPALKDTGVAVLAPAPGAQTMWRVWLGANLTHSPGLLVFALLLIVVAVHDYALVPGIPAIQPLSIAIALTYMLIAVRFWFLPAAATASVGLTCFVIAAIV